ncbi:LysM peptidoglycan-binding domain-containing protein [Halobacillus amylolyticus]|uniref:LysM peptidoglycan-binding domain-containing protein n=1 Tax=Halobacillus amylolyticus TaxID=2932259 RepID=A0ABY4HCN2_9BACI|nr:LysM peptidoglycan-binding domain-containing protein [Halobacillus amylolyticus]UOR12576.1 LysM peptidoglycan-binding domain-containing protein [Halobacillus amylolyticus]
MTLQDIAENNGLSLKDLIKANEMMPPYRADIGDKVEVPLSMVNVSIPPYMPYRKIEKLPHFRQANLDVTKMDFFDNHPKNNDE